VVHESRHTRTGADITGQAHLTVQSSVLSPSSDANDRLALEEDDELARRVAERKDADALAELYRRHVKSVFSLHYRGANNNEAEAKDLTSTTFHEALEGLLKGKWSGQRFRGWLFGIARNVFREWLRKKGRHNELVHRIGMATWGREGHVGETELLDEVLVRQRKEALWELVEELPEPEREVLALRYIHGLKYAEIAVYMDRTEDACKNLHYRAMQKLREKVAQKDL